MGCLGIILLWIVCAIGSVFPPLGIVFIILFFIWNAGSKNNSKSNMEKIHHSKITYPPCRPFDYEIDKDGMVWAKSYYDKKGRKRYCCNPNHNHFYD